MKDFIQGLFFGAAVGGLLALLNTPNDGTENRRIVQGYLRENTENVNELSHDLKNLQESLSRLSNEGMAVANTVTKEGTASVEDFTQRNQPRINRVVDRVNDLTADLEVEQAKFEQYSN